MSYLWRCRDNFKPVLKYGVRLSSWAIVYLPGGNSKFSRLFDKAKVLLFYIKKIYISFKNAVNKHPIIIIHFSCTSNLVIAMAIA
jgi:hypothetical protein